jgi:hypothetical protein
MISPLHGKQAPFRLPSNVIYFHDWRYVYHGYFRWTGADGKGHPLWGPDPVPPMRLEYTDMPLGIELAAQKARKTERFLTPERADFPFLNSGQVMYDDGKYRLWYDGWSAEDFEAGRTAWQDIQVRYAESDDGFDWRLPKLGLAQRRGGVADNVVGGLVGEVGYHGGCVFKDPSAPGAERYKEFFMGHISPEAKEAFLRRRPADLDPAGKDALYGAVSPDGLRWTPIPEPLVLVNSDTQNTCEYDVNLGQYVAYMRSWYFGRRTIGRMVTSDFRRFPVHEEVFWPAGNMKPYELWYTSGKTLIPGTTDYHVMFPMRWTLTEDVFDFHLAASPDNVVWNMVPAGPVCERGGLTDWDAGLAAPGNGMVNLPGDRWGLLQLGSQVPHKHPRRPPLGGMAWATWPKGRLVALKAPVEGSFATWPVLFDGRTVHLNFKTALTGFVKVEAAASDGKVLPGRSFDDCDPMSGDRSDQLVTWKGQSDLGHAENAPVVLRFKLRSADLYSVEFKP